MAREGYTRIDFTAPNALDALYASARSGKPSRTFAILNARFHEQEAYIVAEAGVPGAITIATNMAGRGTDIKLGGSEDMRDRAGMRRPAAGPERDAKEAAIRAEIADFKARAIAAGGLYIIGTERHESRRIDNQLRGRSGRQGDPGSSKFFLSLQDDLMRIFGSERMDAVLTRLGLQENEAIVHPWINKALEKAQQKVEARNFDMRKNVLKYDNVMNDQRKVVFEQRREMMAQESLEEQIGEMRTGVVDDLITRFVPHDAYAESWDTAGLKQAVLESLNLDVPVEEWAKEEGIGDEEMADRLQKAADEAYAARVERNGPDVMRYIEKQVVLQMLDHLWREHLVVLDHLRQVIGWRGLAQRDPLNEYKSEAFDLFNGLITRLRETTTSAAHAGRGGLRAAVQRTAADVRLPQRPADGRRRNRGRRKQSAGRRGVRLRQRHGGRHHAGHRRGGSASRPAGRDDLGQGRPQRALSLRLGAQIQALPRRDRLIRESERPSGLPASRLDAALGSRRCEERSNAAIQSPRRTTGSPRCARDDEVAGAGWLPGWMLHSGHVIARSEATRQSSRPVAPLDRRAALAVTAVRG